MASWFSSVSALPFVLFASAAMAQDAEVAPSASDQEIIVTAQRRAENVQDVPITISSVSSETLADAGVTNLEQLKTLVAGYQGPGDNAASSPHIRGVGSTGIQPGNESVVALYVDDVYIGTPTPALITLNNVARIDVLKGPQGTLFGRNTTGGVVQVSTKTPSQKWAADATVGLANYGTVSSSLYVGGPLSQSVSSDIAVQARTQRDGWGTNLFSGKDVYRTDLDLGVRSRSVFRLSPETEIQVALDYEKVETTGMDTIVPYNGSRSFLGYPSPARGWDADSNIEQGGDTEAWGVSGRLEQQFDFADFVSITAFRDTTFDSRGSDGDGTPAAVFRNDRDQQNKQFTQELRLISPDEGPFVWALGLYYYHAQDDSANTSTLNPMFFGGLTGRTVSGSIETESLAVYAQGTLRLSDQTNLTLGARYTDETAELNGRVDVRAGPITLTGVPTNGKTSNASPTWRIALDHHFTPDFMGYLSYNRGEKSGGFNISNVDLIASPAFAPERLDAYEAGVRTQWWDDRITLNLSGFYYDYTNIQVLGFVGTTTAIFNGAGAELYGLDAEFSASITDRFTLSGSLEALHTEFTSYPNATIYAPLPTGGFLPTVGSAAGNELPLAPNFSGSLTATYDVPTSFGDWRASMTYYHNSGYFTEVDNRLEQPAFDLISASLLYTLKDGRSSVRLWGNNLANERVVNLLLTSRLNTAHKLNAPRTFGITFGYRY